MLCSLDEGSVSTWHSLGEESLAKSFHSRKSCRWDQDGKESSVFYFWLESYEGMLGKQKASNERLWQLAGSD